jgi:hypothetical protein
LSCDHSVHLRRSPSKFAPPMRLPW